MIPWLSSALAATSPLAAGEVLADVDRAAFPTLRADNLHGEVRAYPDWYVGRTSLVFVVWTQEQQRVANTWLAQLKAIERACPELTVVEHPVVAPPWRLMKNTVDGWMRGGIMDDAGRRRTVTLYTSERRLAKELGITDRSTITTLLVDDQGRVAKRWLGAVSEAALADVIASADSLMNPS